MPQRLVYMPTPEEIRAECAKIQAGWTDEERERRRVDRLAREVKIIRFSDLQRGQRRRHKTVDD